MEIAPQYCVSYGIKMKIVPQCCVSYLDLAPKFPNKEFGAILVHRLHLHLVEDQLRRNNNIHDFFFAGLLYVSFHLTSVTSSFSFPSFDIFKENPFCTVIWEEEEEINLAFTCLRKLENLVKIFPVICFCSSPSSNHENMFWCFTRLFWHCPKKSPLHSSFPISLGLSVPNWSKSFNTDLSQLVPLPVNWSHQPPSPLTQSTGLTPLPPHYNFLVKIR